jgi:hypothetical protein
MKNTFTGKEKHPHRHFSLEIAPISRLTSCSLM